VALTAAAVATVLSAQRATAAVPLPLAYSTIQSATPAATGAISARAAVLAKGVLTAMWVTKVTRVAAVAAVLAVGAAGVLATTAWADKPAAKEGKDAKPATLDGTWQVTAFTKDGNEAPKEEADTMKLVISGDTFTVSHREEVVKGKFKTDATQKPATLDLEVTEGGDKGDSQMAIYELDGDTLRVCTAHNGIPRPDKFESTAGSGHILITLKRVKE
jgi:uncharacterized protein (TIGR03067 family)